MELRGTVQDGVVIFDQKLEIPNGTRAVVRLEVVPSPPSEWLPGFWQQLAQGWQGEPLVRPDQGIPDNRDVLK